MRRTTGDIALMTARPTAPGCRAACSPAAAAGDEKFRLQCGRDQRDPLTQRF